MSDEQKASEAGYDHLKPYIAKLMEKINRGVIEIQGECTELHDHDLFVVLYESAMSLAGQILGSAFVSNPKFDQVDWFRRAARSLQIHTKKYQEWFLLTAEQKKEDAIAAVAPPLNLAKDPNREQGMSREQLLELMGTLKQHPTQPPTAKTPEQLKAFREKLEQAKPWENVAKAAGPLIQSMAGLAPGNVTKEVIAGQKTIVEDLGPPAEPRSPWIKT